MGGRRCFSCAVDLFTPRCGVCRRGYAKIGARCFTCFKAQVTQSLGMSVRPSTTEASVTTATISKTEAKNGEGSVASGADAIGLILDTEAKNAEASEAATGTKQQGIVGCACCTETDARPGPGKEALLRRVSRLPFSL